MADGEPRRAPLLLALDDLHWCDLPSLRWLAYLLPRMEGLGLLVSSASGQRNRERIRLIGQIVSDPLATTVRPAALSTEAVARLLRESLSPEADDAFCAACQEATGGNPLLVRELVHAIAAEGLAPTERTCPVSTRSRPVPARARLRCACLGPPEARALAHAVAILGDDVDPRQAAQLARLDEHAVSDAAAAPRGWTSAPRRRSSSCIR